MAVQYAKWQAYLIHMTRFCKQSFKVEVSDHVNSCVALQKLDGTVENWFMSLVRGSATLMYLTAVKTAFASQFDMKGKRCSEVKMLLELAILHEYSIHLAFGLSKGFMKFRIGYKVGCLTLEVKLIQELRLRLPIASCLQSVELLS